MKRSEYFSTEMKGEKKTWFIPNWDERKIKTDSFPCLTYFPPVCIAKDVARGRGEQRTLLSLSLSLILK